MSESEFQIAKLNAFLRAYLEALKICAEPGDKSHMLAMATRWLERRIHEITK